LIGGNEMQFFQETIVPRRPTAPRRPEAARRPLEDTLGDRPRLRNAAKPYPKYPKATPPKDHPKTISHSDLGPDLAGT